MDGEACTARIDGGEVAGAQSVSVVAGVALVIESRVTGEAVYFIDTPAADVAHLVFFPVGCGVIGDPVFVFGEQYDFCADLGSGVPVDGFEVVTPIDPIHYHGIGVGAFGYEGFGLPYISGVFLDEG